MNHHHMKTQRSTNLLHRYEMVIEVHTYLLDLPISLGGICQKIFTWSLIVGLLCLTDLGDITKKQLSVITSN